SAKAEAVRHLTSRSDPRAGSDDELKNLSLIETGPENMLGKRPVAAEKPETKRVAEIEVPDLLCFKDVEGREILAGKEEVDGGGESAVSAEASRKSVGPNCLPRTMRFSVVAPFWMGREFKSLDDGSCGEFHARGI